MTTTQSTTRATSVRSWPLLLLAAPAFVAVWSGWVGLGRLTGFGTVEPLPGIADGFTIDTAITLPVGVETYAAYALRVWLSDAVPVRARRFARWSALGSLLLGAAGQVAYHLMVAAGITAAPWQITAAVACLPVLVLGMGAALVHLVREGDPAGHGTQDHDTGPEVAARAGGGHGQLDVGPHDPGEESEDPGDEGEDTEDEEGQDVEEVRGPVSAPRPAAPLSVAAGPVERVRRVGKRPAGRRAGADTAARVARLRQQRPDLAVAEIARRLGVSDRTVRRHLTAQGATTGTPEGTEDAA